MSERHPRFRGAPAVRLEPFRFMEERRKTTRQRVLKTGSIVFNRAGGIDCLVHNLSSAGAGLEIVTPLGIPDDFTLVIHGEQFQRLCHVIWRRENHIGVVFS